MNKARKPIRRDEADGARRPTPEKQGASAVRPDSMAARASWTCAEPGRLSRSLSSSRLTRSASARRRVGGQVAERTGVAYGQGHQDGHEIVAGERHVPGA